MVTLQTVAAKGFFIGIKAFALSSLIVFDRSYASIMRPLFRGCVFSLNRPERESYFCFASELTIHPYLLTKWLQADNLSHTSPYYAAGHSSNWEKLTIIRYLLILTLLFVAGCCWKGRIEKTQEINLPGRFQRTLSLFLLSFFCYLLLLVQANLEHSKYTSDFYPLGF